MIIRTNRLQEGTKVTQEKGEIKLEQVVDIEPVLQANYLSKKDSQDGFSKDRSIRKVASIPFETWIDLTRKFPEVVLGDRELREKTLKKWLYSAEGKMFWSVNKGI